MLANFRSHFPLFFLFVVGFCLSALVPIHAQVNGVPPSVTSLGFGGNFLNGIRPSVTSLGPITHGNIGSSGYCCANFFWSANPNPTLSSGHRHRPHGDRDSLANGVFEPAYIPYAVPYAPDDDDRSADDDSAVDDDSNSSAPPLPAKHTLSRDPAPSTYAKADLPVADQPSTVLVFKDGRQSDVVNYAIVGDTLFDFEASRTRKILLADLDLKATQRANDDRGVDFEVPDNAAVQ